MFTFTPLLGARSASPALQSLLEFEGGIKILIDIGWDIRFDGEALKELERWVIRKAARRSWLSTSIEEARWEYLHSDDVR